MERKDDYNNPNNVYTANRIQKYRQMSKLLSHINCNIGYKCKKYQNLTFKYQRNAIKFRKKQALLIEKELKQIVSGDILEKDETFKAQIQLTVIMVYGS